MRVDPATKGLEVEILRGNESFHLASKKHCVQIDIM